MEIESVRAREILDSRGNPTLEVEATLIEGSVGRAAVPSGASTGTHEALELRDGDADRYGGKGVLKAVANVNDRIADGRHRPVRATTSAALDQAMIALDGTPDKSKLGANAILGVSLAVARAAAVVARPAALPLPRRADGAAACPCPCSTSSTAAATPPARPTSRSSWSCPSAPPPSPRGCAWAPRSTTPSRRCSAERGLSTNVGDEGGFAPSLAGNSDAVEVVLAAIEAAGYRPGEDAVIALDPAASEFYDADSKQVRPGRKKGAP